MHAEYRRHQPVTRIRLRTAVNVPQNRNADCRMRGRGQPVAEKMAHAPVTGLAAGIFLDNAVAGFVGDGFRHNHQREITPGIIEPANFADDMFNPIGNFRDQDHIRATGDARVQRDMPRIAAHDFQDHDSPVAGRRRLQPVQRFRRDRDRRVVPDRNLRYTDIVVDGLGDTDDAQLVALLLSELGDFVGGILGVVAAGVEEVTDVLSLKDFQHALEIGLLLGLVAAGAEGGAGRVAEATDGLLGFRRQIDEIFIQNTEHTVERAVDFLDAAVVQSFGDNSLDASINDGGGATGLAYQNVT